MPELIAMIETALAELAERLTESEPGADADAAGSCATPVFDRHDTVIHWQYASFALAVVSARALVRWGHDRVWAGAGHRTATHRLAHDTKCNIRRARHDLWRT